MVEGHQGERHLPETQPIKEPTAEQKYEAEVAKARVRVDAQTHGITARLLKRSAALREAIADLHKSVPEAPKGLAAWWPPSQKRHAQAKEAWTQERDRLDKVGRELSRRMSTLSDEKLLYRDSRARARVQRHMPELSFAAKVEREMLIKQGVLRDERKRQAERGKGHER